MTSCVIDEAVRRIIAVGGDLEHIGGVDNFCWPNIQHHPKTNPDGKFKAAQLVRSCRALRDICLAYGIPLLSGKDSMYVDGHLPGRYRETHKVSALETLQFSAIGVVEDITTCVTMDCKVHGDLVYIIGITRNELGASEYYEHLGYVGLNVPKVFPDQFIPIYKGLCQAIKAELVASVHGVYRGGLGVHLILTAIAGDMAMRIDISRAPADQVERDDVMLFSESPGRFIVTIDPANKERFEKIFEGLPCACVGKVLKSPYMTIEKGDELLFHVSVKELREAWKQ